VAFTNTKSEYQKKNPYHNINMKIYISTIQITSRTALQVDRWIVYQTFLHTADPKWCIVINWFNFVQNTSLINLVHGIETRGELQRYPVD